MQKMETKLQEMVQKMYGKDLASASQKEIYNVLLTATKEMMDEKPAIDGEKKIYYISA